MSGNIVLTVGAVLRGDDAAGPYLSKLIQEDPVDGWEELEGGQMPEDYIAVVRRAHPDVLIVFDAAAMDLAPGALRQLEPDDVADDCLMTSHALPLSLLLNELTDSCGKVVFIGVQPAQTEFMNPLTPAVRESVESLYDALKEGTDISSVAPPYEGPAPAYKEA